MDFNVQNGRKFLSIDASRISTTRVLKNAGTWIVSPNAPPEQGYLTYKWVISLGEGWES